jgi:hypothetical protein
MEVSGHLHALAALPLGKEPPVGTDRRLCEPRDDAVIKHEEN